MEHEQLRLGLVLAPDTAKALGYDLISVHPLAAMPSNSYKRTRTICSATVERLFGNPYARPYAPASPKTLGVVAMDADPDGNL